MKCWMIHAFQAVADVGQPAPTHRLHRGAADPQGRDLVTTLEPSRPKVTELAREVLVDQQQVHRGMT